MLANREPEWVGLLLDPIAQAKEPEAVFPGVQLMRPEIAVPETRPNDGAETADASIRPVPAIDKLAALASKFAVLGVITGRMFAKVILVEVRLPTVTVPVRTPALSTPETIQVR